MQQKRPVILDFMVISCAGCTCKIRYANKAFVLTYRSTLQMYLTLTSVPVFSDVMMFLARSPTDCDLLEATHFSRTIFLQDFYLYMMFNCNLCILLSVFILNKFVESLCHTSQVFLPASTGLCWRWLPTLTGCCPCMKGSEILWQGLH